MTVTMATIRHAIRELGLTGRPLCVHSSLRSFGEVAGGAQSVIDALLAEGCTVLVPTFSYDTFAIPPPPDMRPERNGWRYGRSADSTAGSDRTYTTNSIAVDRAMGAIPATLLQLPEHRRGDHPLCSFSAVGPDAEMLIASQEPLAVYAPLRTLAEQGGSVICMGVGLTRMTFLHLAEQRAGRRLFRRWANETGGHPMMVEVGGCSEGFARFDGPLASIERRVQVGASRWRIFPALDVLELAVDAIRTDPTVTHCADAACERCDDAVLGGPLLPEA
jgi:aminoglycoside N3'-acetyltransferase